MDINKTLSPGDILRKIRKELGFKQHELAADDITRNLISLIENNRATLNRGNADILVRNMNNLCKVRGIDIELEFKDLFIPGVYDAKSKARTYIDFLKEAIYSDISINNEKIDEIALFVSRWDLQSQNTHIYELLAQYFNENDNIRTSYYYYIKAFENAVKIDKNPTVVLKLTPQVIDICLKVNRPTDALQIGKIAMSHCCPDNFSPMIPIWYKLATSNYKLGYYDEAIKNINLIEKYVDKLDAFRIADVNIIKLLIFIANRNYKKALDTLHQTEILIKDKDKETELLLQSIELKIYALKGNILYVKNNIEEIDSKISELNFSNIYTSDIYLNVAFSYSYLNSDSKVNELLINSIAHSINSKDINSLRTIIEFIFSSGNRYVDSLNRIFENVDIIEHMLDKEDLIKVIEFLHKYNQFNLLKNAFIN